jgi:hypothetical protein
MGEEHYSVIKFFIIDSSERIEIDHRLRAHCQDDAMKKSAFNYELQRFVQEEQPFSSPDP